MTFGEAANAVANAVLILLFFGGIFCFFAWSFGLIIQETVKRHRTGVYGAINRTLDKDPGDFWKRLLAGTVVIVLTLITFLLLSSCMYVVGNI